MNSETVRALRALSLAIVCTCLFGLSLGRSAALAQTAHEEAAYKELIEQALSEFKHKNWPEARVLFTRAHEQNPNARTLRGMGIVSFEMRDYLNAVVNLKAALEDPRQALTEAQRKECEGLLTRASAYVGVYALKLEPADAQLALDGGEPMRNEEGHLLVPFGEHVLSARAPGRQESSLKLNVQGGERGEVALSLPLERGPESAALPPPAPVSAVDEGAAPPAKNEGARQRSEPKRFVGHGLKYSWLTLGVSAAAGGAAAAFWFLGQNELDALDSQCSARADGDSVCTEQNTDTSKVEMFQTLTNVSIGVSAVALATSVVLMGLEWPRERRIALNVGPTSLSLRGAF